MAGHGERGALPPAEADRHGLPQRARARPRAARLRNREESRRRALRDRGRAAQGHRGVFDPARRDRGGGGGAGRRGHGGQSTARRARGTHDAGPQARRRQGGAARELAAPGRRTRVRRPRIDRQCAVAGGGWSAGRGSGSGWRGAGGCGGRGRICESGPGRAGPRNEDPGGRGRGLGRLPPCGARGGVLPRRPAGRHARLAAGRGRRRGGGEGGGRSPESRDAPCGARARGGRRDDDGQGAR